MAASLVLAWSRDMCNFLQYRLKSLIMQAFKNFLHHSQKRFYLWREIKAFGCILQVFGHISAQYLVGTLPLDLLLESAVRSESLQNFNFLLFTSCLGNLLLGETPKTAISAISYLWNGSPEATVQFMVYFLDSCMRFLPVVGVTLSS